MSIRTENLTVEMGRKRLLEEVSFKAEPGEIIAVLGANGAGKSTLLKALSGEVKTRKGEIFFGDKDLNTWDFNKLAKIRGVLPQSCALDFPFKVKEVALLGRTPHIEYNESKRDHEIALSALKTVEAEAFAERFYPTLSGGERQRVQLARVLAQIWEKPENGVRFLLLDEPTASLDPAHQHLTLQIAKDFAFSETVVIAVLHDLNLAAQYADKILILQNGRKVAFDKPKNVLSSSLIGEVFGIEVYITKHPRFDEIPLIVPIGGYLKPESSLRATV